MVLRRLREEIKWRALVVRGSGVFALWHAAGADDSAGISDVPPGRRRTAGKQGPKRVPHLRRAELEWPSDAGNRVGSRRQTSEFFQGSVLWSGKGGWQRALVDGRGIGREPIAGFRGEIGIGASGGNGKRNAGDRTGATRSRAVSVGPRWQCTATTRERLARLVRPEDADCASACFEQGGHRRPQDFA